MYPHIIIKIFTQLLNYGVYGDGVKFTIPALSDQKPTNKSG